MKTIATMLVLLSTICLGGTSLKSKDFSFAQTNSDTTATYQNTQRLRDGNTISKYFMKAAAASPVSGPVKSEQSTLWEPVTQIEDGAIYMIRSAENHNLYWHLTGGSLNNETQVQLYNLNYSHAQMFYFKKSFDVNGYATYQLSPLNEYSKVLRFFTKAENSILKLDDERYDLPNKELSLFSDRIYFSPSVDSSRFYAHTCFADSRNSGNTYVSVQDASSGQKIKIKDSTLPSNRFIYSWELIKTNILGLQVGNKTYVDGANESRYLVRVPYPGQYVIETRAYGGTSLDTFLTLKKDSTNTVITSNDDDGEGRNAKIIYNFTTTDIHSILLRGYNNNYHGYCYLILRPRKTVYLTATYDYEGSNPENTVNPVFYVSSYVRQLGFFPMVQVNLNHERVFNETDWEGTTKMDRDYYYFFGHGVNNGTYAKYYDGPNGDLVLASDYLNTVTWPDLSNTKLALWMACQSGNEPLISIDHCIARYAAMKGAQKSIGWRDTIIGGYAIAFSAYFFYLLTSNTKTFQTALVEAIQWVYTNSGDFGGLQHPSIFTNNGNTEIRITINGSRPEDVETQIITW